MHNESKLKVTPVNDLLGQRFYVPSYQRGYRWTPIQVTELLNDIWEFHKKDDKTKEEFYCLQPIVVAPVGDEWELIDGQQRLTTIFLILQYLKKGLEYLEKQSYSIRYQTRKESETFLQNINIILRDENIDYHHFCNAYNAIENWFKGKDGNTKITFLTTLLNDDEAGKNVKVIWYEVSQETNAIDIFTRINIGKIPLNNAELVRALFLRKDNFGNGGNPRISLKQMQIASEWDTIENTLQQDSFWHFIYEGTDKYSTRIEYVFDLMKEKQADDEEYFTFHKFNEQFEMERDIDTIWLEVKRYFQTFKDWYNNSELFHLVGYLITTGSSIKKLKLNSQGLSKIQFKNYLTNEIKKTVNFDIYDLEYGDKKVKSLLLLFNIQTIVGNANCHIRFPFHSYKNDNWDIEHIRSVKSDKPAINKQKAWLENVLSYFTGLTGIDDQEVWIKQLAEEEKDKAQKIIVLLKEEKVSDGEFTPLYEELLEFFGENKEPENINAVSNLALLDATTNRSYKNAVFPIKRKTILENEAKGIFVPICTKNVFLKSYSRKMDKMMFWQDADAADYLKAIEKQLSIYLPIKVKADGKAD